MAKKSKDNRRIKLVKSVYQQGGRLNLADKIYKKRFVDFFAKRVADDAANGDATSSFVLEKGKTAKAQIKTTEDGFICGLAELELFYKHFGLVFTFVSQDDKTVKSGETLCTVEGDAITLLSLERTALNIVRCMSGIATITKKFVDILEDFPTKIAATRKTRFEEFLEKSAVARAGGLTHRLGLSEHILIKDCHLDVLKSFGEEDTIGGVIQRAMKSNLPVEIEVCSFDEAFLAAKAFKKIDKKNPKIIMLDNMTPAEVGYTIGFLKNKNMYEDIIFEASGGITLDNLSDFAKAGVDVISTSQITESALVLDIHQKILI